MGATGLAITSDTPLHGRLNYLLAFCAQLASLATTASATSLIALKIIRTTRESQMHYSYTRIVQILVESAALVSIVGLGVGSLQLVTYIQPYDMSTSSGRLLYQLLQYLAAVQTPIMVGDSVVVFIVVHHLNTASQGIGPTLIAFRVAEERSQTRDHATSTRTSPLSRLTFRRTAPGGNVDSLTPRTRASTIQFGQAHQSEQMDCVQAYVDIDARSDASGEKAKEIMKQRENISSTESI
ncbi:hypothetical protein D9619_012549 [Psilocybe cf. subviscida]|uniref:Uncharacterized protein n=1 Tax=Psilocybe cf. subviscida TaxID=2480587 RepID=A0A8H5B714_9AGAR|nr:hypothetical protein D9619_012549 [Psilocybe cf. subviscida]